MGSFTSISSILIRKLKIDRCSLSISGNNEQRTFHSITFNNKALEFRSGFTVLPIKRIQQILKGEGFRLDDATKFVIIGKKIRNNIIITKGGKTSFCHQKIKYIFAP